MTIITLVSGGIDSLVMAKIIKEEGEKQYPLFIDYGQLAREKEWAACKRILSMSSLPEPIKVDLSGYGKLISSGITDPTKDIYNKAFLPGRNLLFLLIGSSFAQYMGADKVAIGLLSEKSHLFPDQTESFIVNANVAINSALGGYFTIVTPLMNFSKGEVLKLGKHFNLPLHETYSCHSGSDKYCGKCISCKEILSSDGGSSLPQFGKGGK
jgi:7-cyano-7-deazaguanine synthase